jgi:cyclophilin family peptidyl-prolyl cis-trans isomerase
VFGKVVDGLDVVDKIGTSTHLLAEHTVVSRPKSFFALPFAFPIMVKREWVAKVEKRVKKSPSSRAVRFRAAEKELTSEASAL